MATIYDSILEHHEDLKNLMKELTSTRTPTDVREKVFKDFAASLEAHAGAEERFFYSPILMHDEGLEKARHGAYEHEEAHDLIEDMKKLDPKGKAFMTKAKKVTKEVRHHMEEEEKEIFKTSKKVLSDSEVKKLNEQYVSDFIRLQKKYAKKG